MICKSCGKENEDDAKYCKECGQRTASPRILGSDEYLKIGELIYSAYRHSEAGRLDDAILACQGALALDPDNASAHALLGAFYERRGDIGMAIAEFERAVALNPSSTADRQKLDDLRAGRVYTPKPGRTQPAQVLEKLKPYAPMIFAVLVVVIVLVWGMNLVGRGPSRTDSMEAARPSETTAQPGSAAYPGSPGQSFAGVPSQSPQLPAQQAPGQQPAAQSPTQTQAPNAPGTNTEQTQREGARSTARPGVPSIPVPGNAQAREQPNATPPAEQKPDTSSGPTPVIVPITEPAASPTPSPAPAPRVSPAPAVRPVPQPVDPEDRALELQRSGKYREAIAAYREALNQTTDPGRVYQQIALSHQRLSEHSLAIDNYNRAVRSYREQLAAGRDANEVQRNIRACEAGIQVSRSHAR